jgi:hypothetical protein
MTAGVLLVTAPDQRRFGTLQRSRHTGSLKGSRSRRSGDLRLRRDHVPVGLKNLSPMRLGP